MTVMKNFDPEDEQMTHTQTILAFTRDDDNFLMLVTRSIKTDMRYVKSFL